MNLSDLSLWLFSIFLGISFGAGLYEARVVIPLWFGKNESGNHFVNYTNLKGIDPGKKFWAFITTVPLTLLTFANFILALKSEGEIQTWWLSASALILVERIATFTFFIPNIIRLQRKKDFPETFISAKISRWIQMNYLRNAVTLIAWIFTIETITLL